MQTSRIFRLTLDSNPFQSHRHQQRNGRHQKERAKAVCSCTAYSQRKTSPLCSGGRTSPGGVVMGAMRALSMVLVELSQSPRKGRHTTATTPPKLAPGISVLLELRQSIKTQILFNHLLSDSFPASNFDAREQSDGCRLNGRTSIDRRRGVRIEGQRVVTRRPVGPLKGFSVASFPTS